ncbi:uncharacterized protein ACIQIH_006676 isoform 2-T6 [Cyanocitta cristata]
MVEQIQQRATKMIKFTFLEELKQIETSLQCLDQTGSHGIDISHIRNIFTGTLQGCSMAFFIMAISDSVLQLHSANTIQNLCQEDFCYSTILLQQSGGQHLLL